MLLGSRRGETHVRERRVQLSAIQLPRRIKRLCDLLEEDRRRAKPTELPFDLVFLDVPPIVRSARGWVKVALVGGGRDVKEAPSYGVENLTI